LSDFVLYFDHRHIAKDAHLALAVDETLPDSLRLAAFSIGFGTVDDRAWPIVERTLSSAEGRRDMRGAYRVIARSDDREAAITYFLKAEHIPDAGRLEIASDLRWFFPDVAKRIAFMNRLVAGESLNARLRDEVLVHAARHGDRAAYNSLVSRLHLVELDVACATLVTMGNWPDRQTGVQAAIGARLRVDNGEEPLGLAWSAAHGLTEQIGEDGYLSGIRSTVLHFAMDEWIITLTAWTERLFENKMKRLSLLLASVKINVPGTIEGVSEILKNLGDPDSSENDDGEWGRVLANAMYELVRHRQKISMDLALRFVRAKRINLPAAGITVIAAQGNRESLDLLLKLYKRFCAGWYLLR
jgi:hypothetical protein